MKFLTILLVLAVVALSMVAAEDASSKKKELLKMMDDVAELEKEISKMKDMAKDAKHGAKPDPTKKPAPAPKDAKQPPPKDAKKPGPTKKPAPTPKDAAKPGPTKKPAPPKAAKPGPAKKPAPPKEAAKPGPTKTPAPPNNAAKPGPTKKPEGKKAVPPTKDHQGEEKGTEEAAKGTENGPTGAPKVGSTAGEKKEPAPAGETEGGSIDINKEIVRAQIEGIMSFFPDGLKEKMKKGMEWFQHQKEAEQQIMKKKVGELIRGGIEFIKNNKEAQEIIKEGEGELEDRLTHIYYPKVIQSLLDEYLPEMLERVFEEYFPLLVHILPKMREELDAVADELKKLTEKEKEAIQEKATEMIGGYLGDIKDKVVEMRNIREKVHVMKQKMEQKEEIKKKLKEGISTGISVLKGWVGRRRRDHLKAKVHQFLDAIRELRDTREIKRQREQERARHRDMIKDAILRIYDAFQE